MDNLIYISFVLISIFFFIVIGEIFKLKKDVRKLDKITSHLIKEVKK